MYMQKVVKVRDTKFGVAMVLEAGTMVLGFKVDPYEALKKVIKEIQSLHQVYSACPIFGVEYSDVDDEGEGPATPTTDAIQEDVELVNTKQDTLAVSFVYPCTAEPPIKDAELKCTFQCTILCSGNTFFPMCLLFILGLLS